jgi:hypothetical protein
MRKKIENINEFAFKHSIEYGEIAISNISTHE